jgi:hypothetical protein
MLLLPMSTLGIQDCFEDPIAEKKVYVVLVLILRQFCTFSKEPIWDPGS